MAVYKIFPEKTATIYSFWPTKNTGLDEIIDISTYISIQEQGEVARGLIKFTSEEINNVIQSKVGAVPYSASLKLFYANASNLPTNYKLYCYPVYGDWDRGTGRAINDPITTDGASWKYKKIDTIWITSSYAANTTASFASFDKAGGGNWYYNYQSSQSFTFNDPKDINFDITQTVRAFQSGSITNQGFIIKQGPEFEFLTGSSFELKYFSGTTHTIYPPCLEIKWDDSIYITGSLNIVSTDKIITTLGNNKEEYQQNSVQKFRINVRDQYPVRTFQTSSVYLNNKLLPTSSYWAIKDLDSEEYVIDFDTSFTKISADGESNYFIVYMDGLQPERYYKILIKTIINGSTIILDDNNIFKVIK